MKPTHPSYVQPETKPDLVLPGHHVEFIECGRKAFEVLAGVERYFIRDRVVFELIKDQDGARLIELSPEAFRSQLEEYFTLRTWLKVHDKLALTASRCSASNATALLKSSPAWQLLPPIKLVTASPVFIARNSTLEILRKGYHDVLGGIYVSRDYEISEVSLPKAVEAILALASDFCFVAPADKSRFIAALIAPSLRFGGLIDDDFPLVINEADKIQTGKTYAHKVLCQLYNEKPFTVTLDDGNNAAGSHDEKLSKGLIEGHPFIMWENVRGLLNSQMAESAIRGTGTVPCRIPYMAPVEIPTDRVFWLLSSNRVDVTPDLSARALITRLRKQTRGYRFRRFGNDRDLLAEVEYNGAFYLSCILAVVQTWFKAGRPTTDDCRHDFRGACQVLDWIVQNVFALAPLLDDHEGEQERISNPLLNWLRDIALAVEKEKRTGEWLRAAQIADICSDHDVLIPHCRADCEDKYRNQYIGKHMKHLFEEMEILDVNGFRIERQNSDEYDVTRQKNIQIIHYRFSK
jgi:hypothetical protein